MVRTNYFNNGKLYCSKIEGCILDSWEDNKKHISQLTVRDFLVVRPEGNKCYQLWNTELVRCSCTGDISINITGNDDMDYTYYSYRGRPREVIITQTTKNRLNLFLNYYGFNSLEVHSSMKEWCVKYNGEELKVNSWYKLDFENKNLVLID